MGAAADGTPIETVREVWVRERATKKGALVGGGLGAVAGGALLGFFVYAMDRDSDWLKGGAYGAALGGAAGAATGLAVGSAIPRWERVGFSARDKVGSGISLHIQATEALSVGAKANWHSRLASGPHMDTDAPGRRLSPLSVTG